MPAIICPRIVDGWLPMSLLSLGRVYSNQDQINVNLFLVRTTSPMVTDLSSLENLLSLLRKYKVTNFSNESLSVQLSDSSAVLQEALSEYTSPTPEEPTAEELLYWSS